MIASYDVLMNLRFYGTLAVPLLLFVAFVVNVCRRKSVRHHFIHSQFRLTPPTPELRNETDRAEATERAAAELPGQPRTATAAALQAAARFAASDCPLPRVRALNVRSGALIDSIAFEFADGTTVTYGGSGGTLDSFPLDHENGEFLARIQVRCGDYVDGVRFLTSTGRESRWFGSDGGGVALEFQLGGGGDETLAPAPRGNQPTAHGSAADRPRTGHEQLDPIMGLAVSASARGWLRHIWQVLDERQVRALVQQPRAVEARHRQAHFLQHHALEVYSNFNAAYSVALAVAILWALTLAPLALEVLRGPTPLEELSLQALATGKHQYVSLQYNSSADAGSGTWSDEWPDHAWYSPVATIISEGGGMVHGSPVAWQRWVAAPFLSESGAATSAVLVHDSWFEDVAGADGGPTTTTGKAGQGAENPPKEPFTYVGFLRSLQPLLQQVMPWEGDTEASKRLHAAAAAAQTADGSIVGSSEEELRAWRKEVADRSSRLSESLRVVLRKAGIFSELRRNWIGDWEPRLRASNGGGMMSADDLALASAVAFPLGQVRTINEAGSSVDTSLHPRLHVGYYVETACWSAAEILLFSVASWAAVLALVVLLARSVAHQRRLHSHVERLLQHETLSEANSTQFPAPRSSDPTGSDPILRDAVVAYLPRPSRDGQRNAEVHPARQQGLGMPPEADATAVQASLVRSIEAELFEAALSTENVFDYDNTHVADCPGWLVVARPFSILAVAVQDLAIVGRERLMRSFTAGEPVELLIQTVASRRGPYGADQQQPGFQNVNEPALFFHRQIQLPREHFHELRERFFSRVRAAMAAIQEQQQHAFLSTFQADLRRLLADGIVFESESHNAGSRPDAHRRAAEGVAGGEAADATQGWGQDGQCLGGCGFQADVKIVKRCTTCPERAACFCAPGWCHRCIFKWWVSRNQTKIEMGLPLAMHWQARCPTCRTYFCLDDCIPVSAVFGSSEGPPIWSDDSDSQRTAIPSSDSAGARVSNATPETARRQEANADTNAGGGGTADDDDDTDNDDENDAEATRAAIRRLQEHTAQLRRRHAAQRALDASDTRNHVASAPTAAAVPNREYADHVQPNLGHTAPAAGSSAAEERREAMLAAAERRRRARRSLGLDESKKSR
eukprot:INCI13349.1.p1 GENE.INCI13349.1~~INCI13349.1.p1  ORF type:complete len:1136 (-),score=197.09 INCI13349.1:341-3748(-)